MIRVFNNTDMSLDTLFLLWNKELKLVRKMPIESITFEFGKVMVFGIDCIIAEFKA